MGDVKKISGGFEYWRILF